MALWYISVISRVWIKIGKKTYLDTNSCEHSKLGLSTSTSVVGSRREIVREAILSFLYNVSICLPQVKRVVWVLIIKLDHRLIPG